MSFEHRPPKLVAKAVRQKSSPDMVSANRSFDGRVAAGAMVATQVASGRQQVVPASKSAAGSKHGKASMYILSERMILRPWKDADRQPLADMSADPSVMEYLLPLTPGEATDAWIDRQLAHQATHGYCFWAVEAKEDGAFVGAVGLLRVSYEAHFTPAVEVGWRIARAFWGQGYAPEAAAAAIRFGFEMLGLPEIVANTVPNNQKSRRVMAKLGMVHDTVDDFDYPRVPEGHPLRRQVLYRLTRDRWLKAAN